MATASIRAGSQGRAERVWPAPCPHPGLSRYIQMLKDHRPRVVWDSQAEEHFFEYKK
jgi:hypothetical protein